jgi:cytochrome c oxidase assembly protein subunit 11
MMNARRRRSLKVVAPCLVVIGIMVGLVAYSPTLYRLFCAATGFGGTTQRVEADLGRISNRTVTVQFDSNVAPDLPWRFEPTQREVSVRLGEQKLVFFTAENLSDKAIVGHATFNVTPQRIGIYFNKIQCFCFTDERLDAHEKVDMPVVFFVDPAMAGNPETRSVNTITLSYTFFRAAKPDNVKDLSRFLTTTKPDAIRGQRLFTERCSACHALDVNKFGPMLGGVVGRKAGSAAGYNYSLALRGADLTWSADHLDRWLTDPRTFIAGTKMPVRVPDSSTRRDIIAYLALESRKPSDRTEDRWVVQGSLDQDSKE